MFTSYPDIHDTRRCQHGKQMDDYCEPCEEHEQIEAQAEKDCLKCEGAGWIPACDAPHGCEERCECTNK